MAELIGQSRQLERIVAAPIQREVRLSGSFSVWNNTDLNIDRLKAVVIQSRGDVVQEIKCARCACPKTRVFDDCILLDGFGNNGCAGDHWFKKGADCVYSELRSRSFTGTDQCVIDTRTGGTVDPIRAQRAARAGLRNQAIILDNMRVDGQDVPAALSYNQNGILSHLPTIGRTNQPHTQHVVLHQTRQLQRNTPDDDEAANPAAADPTAAEAVAANDPAAAEAIAAGPAVIYTPAERE